MKLNTLFYKQYKTTASQMYLPDSLLMSMPTGVRISYHPMMLKIAYVEGGSVSTAGLTYV